VSNSKDSLNRSDIESSLIKEFPDLTKAQISKSIDVIIDSIVEAVAVDEKVEIRGFGTLKKKINKAKLVRNPKTNEKLYKKENFKLHFKIGKVLHNELNSKLPGDE